MRLGLVLGLCLIVSACDLPILQPSDNAAREAVTVTRNAVQLDGPEGYCVDEDSLTATETDAFVVFGNCQAIAGDTQAKQPDIRAIATVSVTVLDDPSAAISGRTDALASFFKTDDGREALSTTGSAENVETLKSYSEDEMVILRVSDSESGERLGVSDTYWRSYFDAKLSIVAVSVLSLNTAPLTENSGLKLLRQFSDQIRSEQIGARSTPGQTGPEALLRRLFN